MSPEEQDLDLLTNVANKLNDMLEADRYTIENIFSPVYICSASLSDTCCRCYLLANKVATGAFGVLVGVLPIQTDVYDLGVSFVDNRVAGFIVINCKDKQTDK